MNGLPVIEKITSFPFYLRYQVQPHLFLMMTYRPLAKYHFGLGFIVLLFVMVIGCEKEAPIYQVAAGEKQMWPQDLSLREAAKLGFSSAAGPADVRAVGARSACEGR